MTKVTFHGVRGSVPVSGKDFAIFGGHTTCVEISTPDLQIIIDTGSGFQNVKISDTGPVMIAYTHFHHDHIQGLAFNVDLLRRDREIFVTSALCRSDVLKNTLQNYFHGAYFPIDFVAMKHQFNFVDFDEIPKIFSGILESNSMPLNHPGGCAAYKFGMAGSHVATLFDNEFEQDQRETLLDFSADASLIVWDGMFLEEELVTRQGWGHSSIEDGMRFFEDVRRNIGGSRLAIMHHAPSRTDRQLNELATQFLNSDMFFATENQQIII